MKLGLPRHFTSGRSSVDPGYGQPPQRRDRRVRTRSDRKILSRPIEVRVSDDSKLHDRLIVGENGDVQTMVNLGWKVLLPLGLVNIVVIVAVRAS